MAWLRNRGTHAVPDGQTVTPTDDVQILLNCANIWNKAYTTIAQLLADSTTLQAVINSNNAIDYLVRSTTFASSITANSTAMADIGGNNYASNTLLVNSTWLTAICDSTYFESVLNKKIPTMTSNTEPSGTCFGSSYFNVSHPYYCAFDGSTSTSWLPARTSSSTGQYIGYTFPSNVKAYMYTLDYTEYTYTSKIVIQGSNGTWSNLTGTLTLAGQSSTATLSLKNRFEQNVDEYTSYRIYISQGTSVDGYAKCFCALRFNVYGREDV